ncbi:MAG: roadblock/LC7 domain-containing protein [Calditerrivibrio sp.]|nr:roadblock/LC7 domain-containing protein [Calditerrivibrio sp.]
MFSNILSHIINHVNGTKMVAVFDKDGFVVYKMGREDMADEIGAEFSSMLRYFKKISSTLDINNVHSFLFEGDNRKLFFKKINESYYFAVSMEPKALVGKLRYILDMFNDEIQKEFQ